LLNITTRHASDEEAVGAAFVLGSTAARSGRATPTKTIIKSARKGAKGGKKGQKCQPHHLAAMASNDSGGAKADNSDEGFVAMVECDFKRQTRSHKDHFKKLPQVVCPRHPYPIKHKLKDYTMLKKFMTSGAPPKGGKLEGGVGGKSVATIPGEAQVMTIFG
jgi:hypothetical protein